MKLEWIDVFDEDEMESYEYCNNCIYLENNICNKFKINIKKFDKPIKCFFYEITF